MASKKKAEAAAAEETVAEAAAAKTVAVTAETVAATEAAFSKKQLRNCREFQNRKDLLNVILKDDQTYTKSEVRSLIEEFLSRPVNKKK